MSSCHRCEHGQEIADGKYAGMAFEDTPCANCVLNESSAFTIEFDPERGDKRLLEGFGKRTEETRRIAAHIDGEEMAPDGLSLPITVMRELVATILTLPPEVRDVICWRFSGRTYGDIALVQNVTTSAVEMRHKRAMKQYPVLRALFPEKAAKQGRRKPHERRPAA